MDDKPIYSLPENWFSLAQCASGANGLKRGYVDNYTPTATGKVFYLSQLPRGFLNDVAKPTDVLVWPTEEAKQEPVPAILLEVASINDYKITLAADVQANTPLTFSYTTLTNDADVVAQSRKDGVDYVLGQLGDLIVDYTANGVIPGALITVARLVAAAMLANNETGLTIETAGYQDREDYRIRRAKEMLEDYVDKNPGVLVD